MKYDYNPLSNRTKSDPVSENAINNIMHNDKIKEKKKKGASWINLWKN